MSDVGKEIGATRGGKWMGKDERLGMGFTNLCPDKFRQRPDELRRRIAVALEALFVDDLTDCVPERGLEALHSLVSMPVTCRVSQ